MRSNVHRSKDREKQQWTWRSEEDFRLVKIGMLVRFPLWAYFCFSFLTSVFFVFNSIFQIFMLFPYYYLLTAYEYTNFVHSRLVMSFSATVIISLLAVRFGVFNVPPPRPQAEARRKCSRRLSTCPRRESWRISLWRTRRK